MIKDIEMKAKEEADIKAKDIIVGAIQRCAADQVADLQYLLSSYLTMR